MGLGSGFGFEVWVWVWALGLGFGFGFGFGLWGLYVSYINTYLCVVSDELRTTSGVTSAIQDMRIYIPLITLLLRFLASTLPLELLR